MQVVNSLQKGSFPIGMQGTLAAVAVTAGTTMTSLGLLLHAEFMSESHKNGDRGAPDEGPEAVFSG